VAVLERFLDYLRAVITIQQDVSYLKGNVQRLADHLVNAKERIVALEKEMEYLRRELKLRDENSSNNSPDKLKLIWVGRVRDRNGECYQTRA
jgi:hypothetical protein